MRTNGAAIRALRIAMGYSNRRFSAAVEISPEYLSNIEAGRRQASPEVRVRIAKTLDVPLAAIVNADAAAEELARVMAA